MAVPQAELERIVREAGAITFTELKARIGKIDFSKSPKFHGTAGGQNDDSRRGFGPTSQSHDYPSSTGWVVTHHDNAYYSTDGISGAVDPDGIRWSADHVQLDKLTYTTAFTPVK